MWRTRRRYIIHNNVTNNSPSPLNTSYQEHIAKGSLTFDHTDIDTHAFIRAQARADVGLDSNPVRLDVDEEEREEEEEDEEVDDTPLLDDDGEPLLEELGDDEDQYSEQF